MLAIRHQLLADVIAHARAIAAVVYHRDVRHLFDKRGERGGTESVSTATGVLYFSLSR